MKTTLIVIILSILLIRCSSQGVKYSNSVVKITIEKIITEKQVSSYLLKFQGSASCNSVWIVDSTNKFQINDELMLITRP